MPDPAVDSSPIDPAYRSLYKLGGIAAFTVVALTLAEIVLLILYPQPAAIADWFAVFQRSKLIGLIDFWGLEIPMYVMFALVFLALYVALHKIDQGYMAVVLAFVLLGVAIFLATNNPFTLLSLTHQYAEATSDAQRSTLLAAGQAALANTNQRGVGGFNIALFLVTLASLAVSWVMLKGGAFSRSTAIMGIVSNLLALADYLRQALTSEAMIALLVILPGALLLMIWYIMLGRRLYQLARLE